MKKYKFLILFLFSVLSSAVAVARDYNEDELMQFLYARITPADSADRDETFYRDYAVKPAIRAMNEMSWGDSVPDELFKYFILPLRINNEALDRHRVSFYEELKPRVHGRSMKDAILAINHWCHEKVTYQPSDGRTHSPLQSVSSAIGRCGEESTFTVAALRTMGIPARQVYTPRWAHTDDNHAWVEAWADGKWWFLGACEPEPVLNLGWFNEPAARGMLMHARVFGDYQGTETVIAKTTAHTDLNVTDHYAPTKNVSVRVVNDNQEPVDNAKVSFRIYNYAEFYPLATRYTGKDGITDLTCGLGSLMVWATDGKRFGYAMIAPDALDASIILSDNLPLGTLDIDVNAPVAVKSKTIVSDTSRGINDRLCAIEDSIRGAYTSTFINPETAKQIAHKYQLDSEDVANILIKSRGNHATITQFWDILPINLRNKSVNLLLSLSDKDLTDVTTDVLNDHIQAIVDTTLWQAQYIMSPRIEYEALTPYRSELSKLFSDAEQAQFLSSPATLVNWVNENIVDTLSWYPDQVTMSPVAVMKHRVTSPRSRNIFYVALARTLGIPSRIDPVTMMPQWADEDKQWHDAMFGAKLQDPSTLMPKHTLTIDYKPTSNIADPLYYSHFTISKIVDGEPQLLNYPDFIPLSQLTPDDLTLEEGIYMITTGQRLANGNVLAHTDFINLNEDKTIDLTIRQDSTQVQVIGSFDAETLYRPLGSDASKSILSTTGRGYYVLGYLRSNHEPSNHALRDIALVKEQLERTNIPIVLVFDSPSIKNNDEILLNLPNKAYLGTELENKIGSTLSDTFGVSVSDMPVFIIADTFNRVVFVTNGYNIGLGQKLLDTIHKL